MKSIYANYPMTLQLKTWCQSPAPQSTPTPRLNPGSNGPNPTAPFSLPLLVLPNNLSLLLCPFEVSNTLGSTVIVFAVLVADVVGTSADSTCHSSKNAIGKKRRERSSVRVLWFIAVGVASNDLDIKIPFETTVRSEVDPKRLSRPSDFMLLRRRRCRDIFHFHMQPIETVAVPAR